MRELLPFKARRQNLRHLHFGALRSKTIITFGWHLLTLSLEASCLAPILASSQLSSSRLTLSISLVSQVEVEAGLLPLPPTLLAPPVLPGQPP